MDVQMASCNNTSDPLCYEESSGLLAVIVIPALLSLSTVGVLVLILINLLRKTLSPGSRLTSSHGHDVNNQECISINGTMVRPPLSSQDAVCLWEIPGDCTLEGLEFWQSGRYGPICRASLRREATPTPVVVKTLRDSSNQGEARQFVEWVRFHATVCKHDNVVRMLFCQCLRLPMYMVLETCSPGNLLHFLWAIRNSDSEAGDSLQHFSEKSVFLIAKQVATGLDYLLSEHRLLHGDVAARNILIGPGLSARVSGLGLAFSSRQKDTVTKEQAEKVPLKWQAPERILKLPTTDRSDVWSFGILLYEMITLGSAPFPELEPLAVLPQLQKHYRMKRPESCGVPLYDLMKYCWMWNFKDRPAFSAIIKLLESYTYLAGTKALHSTEGLDTFEYRKKAGIFS
ncbi:tyrosine-protein kinase STYK1 isoform X2 [Hypomesus transpacificus]|uniref:tyrosine-protein kinase STYK1 isoform X2 n=1 Tax=Hypomesus transpacificus TaxID=137520 RepID=UPI001F08263C|nr:tyrosine-protein kinase STYK1 isoform X2 [Hypomesus transpacificus]